MQPSPILNGTNSLGLNPSDGRLVIALTAVSWTDPAYDAIITHTANSFFDNLDALTTKYSVKRDYKYLNYALSPQQKPFDGYGAANKAKLQAASKKYDGGKLFQTGVPGGFKLFV